MPLRVWLVLVLTDVDGSCGRFADRWGYHVTTCMARGIQRTRSSRRIVLAMMALAQLALLNPSMELGNVAVCPIPELVS